MEIAIGVDANSGSTRRVMVSGKLDTHTHGELDVALAPLLDSPAVRTLVFDFARLDYISSAGIRSVFKARKALAAREGKVLVVNLQPQIRKVFDIV
jgi:anti-anti-sigma factor